MSSKELVKALEDKFTNRVKHANNTFGDRVKAFRGKNHMSQEEFVNRLNVYSNSNNFTVGMLASYEEHSILPTTSFMSTVLKVQSNI